MSSSDYNTISNVISTGTIIAIVIGSIGSVAFVIGTIIVIVCVVKHSNRRRNQVIRGMALQQPYQYPYPQPWPNQYQPNTISVANYPTITQAGPAPYTASAPTYEKTPYN